MKGPVCWRTPNLGPLMNCCPLGPLLKREIPRFLLSKTGAVLNLLPGRSRANRSIGKFRGTFWSMAPRNIVGKDSDGPKELSVVSGPLEPNETVDSRRPVGIRGGLAFPLPGSVGSVKSINPLLGFFKRIVSVLDLPPNLENGGIEGRPVMKGGDVLKFVGLPLLGNILPGIRTPLLFPLLPNGKFPSIGTVRVTRFRTLFPSIEMPAV